uniref:AsIV-cont00102-ORF1 n=1 Tax=Apophua simplicipes ichnovirus TaxID=1329648 RepID=S5DMN4_9VIRU|nr:AsIV-cont00102-ORF1 [Apophua simplicipes ichnovirus]
MDNTLLVEMISQRNANGDNFFHEVCRAGSLGLLKRIQPYITQDLRHLLKVTNYQGKQCMHITVSRPQDCTSNSYCVFNMCVSRLSEL